DHERSVPVIQVGSSGEDSIRDDAFALETPMATVSYVSHGNILIVAGDAPERALRAARSLASALHVTLLSSDLVAAAASIACWTGRVESIRGYLGQFDVTIPGLRT